MLAKKPSKKNIYIQQKPCLESQIRKNGKFPHKCLSSGNKYFVRKNIYIKQKTMRGTSNNTSLVYATNAFHGRNGERLIREMKSP